MPIRAIITQSRTADCTQSNHLIKGLPAEQLLADLGCNRNSILLEATQQGVQVLIP